MKQWKYSHGLKKSVLRRISVSQKRPCGRFFVSGKRQGRHMNHEGLKIQPWKRRGNESNCHGPGGEKGSMPRHAMRKM